MERGQRHHIDADGSAPQGIGSMMNHDNVGRPSSEALDVLVVGAGPTGLTLAAQLKAHGVRFRIIDRLVDRARESRALAVQARSLEIFQAIGVADALVSRGTTTARVMIHFDDDRAVVEVPLGEVDAADTRVPFILFVSQAETEAVLSDHLRSSGVTIERGIELTAVDVTASEVACVLRHGGGGDEHVSTRFVVGCDGAHSTVRKLAGIPFEGGAYPQDFLLADVEVHGGLNNNMIHAFPRGSGFAIFFPLGSPRPWRVIAMAGTASDRNQNDRISAPASIEELQSIADASTGGALKVSDPAWITRFRLHHRQTRRYREGPMFLAGDAAHIHSPVGAQGMNTGIQDAWNLGWKLALVVQGRARAELLDSYEAERWPIGRFLLRVTDRVFSVVTRAVSSGRVVAWVRRAVVPRILSRVVGSRRLRTLGFRFVSELDIRYRSSPIVREGEPRLNGGPRAGDRFPDGFVKSDSGTTYLLQALAGPSLHLMLCGPVELWDAEACAQINEHGSGLVSVHHLTREAAPGALVDESGEMWKRLALRDAAQYLIRPDGYIAYRCAGSDLTGVVDYLCDWFPSTFAHAPPFRQTRLP
jgi:2-polyprenyl-6-methoxyphenol hydroxylase-like FAD-dependent oxidoreductase